MAHSPADSRLKLTAEEEQKVLSMDHYEISAYMHELYKQRGYTVQDSLNASVEHELTPAETVDEDLKQVTINGTVVRGTQAQIDDAMRQAFMKNSQQQDDQPARASNGRFAKTQTASVTDDADLIASDVVMRALAAQGIDPDALRDASENKKYEKSWAASVEDFLKSTPDYPGGDELQQRMGAKLLELGLTDKPSVESLRAAYDSISAETEQYIALQKATSSDEVAEILGINARRVAARTSSMWGK